MYDDWQLPLRKTEDIPIHRPSVGGMGLNHAEPEFKPYVYRGIGTDLYETKAYLAEAEARYQAERWKAEVEATRLRLQRQRREKRKQVQRELSEREEQRQINSIPHLVEQMHADIEAALARAAAERNAIPVTSPSRPKHKPRARGWRPDPRPSAGWRPSTGADIEALLDEYT